MPTKLRHKRKRVRETVLKVIATREKVGSKKCQSWLLEGYGELSVLFSLQLILCVCVCVCLHSFNFFNKVIQPLFRFQNFDYFNSIHLRSDCAIIYYRLQSLKYFDFFSYCSIFNLEKKKIYIYIYIICENRCLKI